MEGFREYTDSNRVFSIAVPEAAEALIQDPARFESEREPIDFSWLILKGEGLAVRVMCSRLEDWHKHVTYNQARTKEEYSKEALLLNAERMKRRFPENSASIIQWSKNILQKEIEGGFMSIRLATWWGANPVPHSLTCFAAVSEQWIALGSIEEDVPASTGEIMHSFTFLPPSAGGSWD
jgi:hypothetical protein